MSLDLGLEQIERRKPNGSSTRSTLELNQDPFSNDIVPTQKRIRISEEDFAVNEEYYDILKKASAGTIDLLARNEAAITPLSNKFFSKGVIPEGVHLAVLNPTLSPHDRATKLINSVLATLKICPNPRGVLEFFMDSTSSVNSCIKREDDDHILSIFLRSMMMLDILLLHERYTGIMSSLRNHIVEAVSPSPCLKLDDIAGHASQYLGRNVADGNVKEFFTSIAPDHNFIEYKLIKNLAKKYVPQNDKLHAELADYDASVKEFLNSPEMKELLLALKGNGRIGIKLDGSWCKMSISLLEVVIKSQHAAEPDIMNRVKIQHC